jgi:hypothetical protein
VATRSIRVPSVDALGHSARVEISPGDPSGWDVTATLDGRIVATRHCRDWHRTERARAAVTSELRALARRLVEVGALLALLVGGPAGVTYAQDLPAAPPSPADSGPTAIFAEPLAIARAIDFTTRTLGDGSDVKSGFYPEMSNMPTGAGWITAGPGYRYWLFGDQMFIDGSAAVSWRAYKMAQARIELPELAKSRLALGTQVRWQDLTQVTYFGDGADSLDTNRSEYRLTSTNVAAYATVRPTRWLSLGGRIGWLDRPSLGAPTGTFQRGNPPTQEVFGGDPVFSLSSQPSFGYREASIAADTRNRRGHPTTGGLYRAAWAGYTDQDQGTFSFRRSELEAAHFIPVSRSRVVFAMHGWLVASHTADDEWVPFYLEPSLGGHNTLRSYSEFRFHDRNLLVVNLETRIALFDHLDAAVFADAGNVAPHVADVNLDKRSYGAGLRLHSRESTFARVDIAHGDEGWRFMFRLSDPLQLKRLTRRTAPVPFVP